MKGIINSASTAAEKIGNAVDQNTTTDEERLEQHTQRLISDNKAEDYVTRTIRPYLMIFLCFAFTGLIIADMFGFQISVEYKQMIMVSFPIGLGFYFGGRTIEKTVREQTKNNAQENRIDRRQTRFEDRRQRRNNK